MSDFSMEDLLQRFAISALSKERREEAVNEEILVGKYTGEFFIKSKDGVVISTDILNRLKASSDDAVRLAESVGMVGDLYRLEFDNINMPTHIDYGVNIIESEPIEIDGPCKGLLFNLDYDEFDIIGSDIKPINSEAIVQIKMNIGFGNGEFKELVIEKSIQIINQSIIDLKEYENVISVDVVSIVIDKDDTIFYNNAEDRTIILHNMFMTMNI